jgi:acetyl esterase/lipase
MLAGQHTVFFPPNPVCDKTGSFSDEELAQVRLAMSPSFRSDVFNGVVPEVAEQEAEGFPEGSLWVDSRAGLEKDEDDDEDSNQLPAIVFLHSGGGVAGSARAQAGFAYSLSRYSGYPVLSLEYPLMPEHTLTEAGAVTVAAIAKLQQSRSRVILVGVSGGCAVALQALVAGARPTSTVFISPMVWPQQGLPSHTENAATEYFSAHTMKCMWSCWRVETALFEADWTKFGPVFVTAGEKEMFVDDAREMAKKLEASGYVKGDSYELEVVPNMVHMGPLFIGWFSEAHTSLNQICDWIKTKNN